jgi:zinc protease
MRAWSWIRLPAPAALLLALLVAAPAAAAPHLVRTFPNKITLVTREVRTRPLVCLQAWVRAGSRDESRQERGVAGVLAQQLFVTTEGFKEGELEKEVQNLGGSISGETGFGYTLYTITVPNRSANRAVELLAEGLLRTRLDARFLEQGTAKARRAVRGPLGTPEGLAVNAAHAALWAGTPLGEPHAVPEIEIAGITLPLVERYYRSRYVAENLLLVATGDVDSEDMAARLETAFASMPRGTAVVSKAYTPPSFSGPRITVEKSPADVSGAGITAAYRGPAGGTADAIALDVLLALLVDSPTSRFRTRLAEGATEFLDASATRAFEREGGLFTISLGTAPDRVLDAEGVLLGEIEKVKSTPIDPEEFQTAVRTVIARDLFPSAELEGLGRATALPFVQGAKPGADEVYFDRLRALRPEDLVGVARKYLDPKQACFFEMSVDGALEAIGAKKDPDKRIREKLGAATGTYGTGPGATASADGERRGRLDAPLARIPKEPVASGRGAVERIVLPGGMRLLVSEDWSAPLSAVGVYMLGGVRYETDADNGITSLLREALMNADDPARPGYTCRQSLLRLGRLVPYQDRDMWGYSVSMPGGDTEAVMKLLGGMLTPASLDTVTVDASRISVMRALDAWQQDDEAQRARLIFPARYTVHGYRLPGLGNRRNLAAIPQAEIEAWLSTFVVRPNVVITVFGAVHAADVRAWAEQAFGRVPDRAFAPPPVAREPEFTTEFREKWELGQGPRSTVTIMFAGPRASSPDVPALYVMSALLSGPRGWYARHVIPLGVVMSATSIVAQAIDESPLIMQMETDGTTREEEGVRFMFRQIKKAALLPLVGEELSEDLRNAKVNAIGSYLRLFTSNTSRAFHWARADLFGLGVDYPLTLVAKMDALTSDSFQPLGLKYFQKDEFQKKPYAIAETRPGGW